MNCFTARFIYCSSVLAIMNQFYYLTYNAKQTIIVYVHLSRDYSIIILCINNPWLTFGARARLALSFVRSFVLSIALQRSVLTFGSRLRYEQAKHDNGLQCDSWISLKCFCSRVIAGLPWRPSWSFLKTNLAIVGFNLCYRTVIHSYRAAFSMLLPTLHHVYFLNLGG